MSFLAISAIITVVLTFITGASVVVGKALQSNPFLPPPDGALIAIGLSTTLTAIGVATTAVAAIARFL